jgi:hypothetical protein
MPRALVPWLLLCSRTALALAFCAVGRVMLTSDRINR